LSVSGSPNERSLEAARVVRSGQRRSRHEYPDLTAPLEIAGEIGNYIKLDTDFG
jgi:hypothetical protein